MIQRLGIDPKWPAAWKRQTRVNREAIQIHDETNRKRLTRYIKDGTTGEELGYPVDPVSPPPPEWETFLGNPLNMHGGFRLVETECNSLDTDAWDVGSAAHSFASVYTGTMIDLRTHALFPTRFTGRTLTVMSPRNVPFAGLGLITGAREQSLLLAKLQIAAFAHGFYSGLERYPVFGFMLRLMADYLAMTPPRLTREAANEALLNQLFEAWRAPRAEALEPLCLAACDYHTHRCTSSNDDEFLEFDINWMRTPIEILLLFKLRQMLGLGNPTIDHPLMNTALGSLPEEVGFQPDDSVARVRARMMQDGYDEDEIARLVLS